MVLGVQSRELSTDLTLVRTVTSLEGGRFLDSASNAFEQTQVSGDSLQKAALRAKYRILRSAVDRALALLLLVLCAPVLLVIGAAIRLQSPGPAIFRQQRVGKDGKSFTIMKLRTMAIEAPAYSLKIADPSPMITKFGRLLRRTGLDELPQLWNVLRGDMAIIGPRPEQIELVGLYEPWQLKRHLVRPGITGWWQIHHRDGSPLHHNIEKDLYYIRHQGPMIDLAILLGTFKILVFGLLKSVPTPKVSSSASESMEVPPSEGRTARSID